MDVVHTDPGKGIPPVLGTTGYLSLTLGDSTKIDSCKKIVCVIFLCSFEFKLLYKINRVI